MPKLTLEESLAKNGFLTYRIRGVSMQPMLRQGRDLFTVVPKGPERCKKYDVVLYRRPSDPYVLHRIIDNICTFCATALFLELCVYYKTLAGKLYPRTC